ncbi:MAG: hypothetical protein IPM51_10250 [Sphingobacteriaceae bacterium]|nr:hypothetical protein [Sphingobacteriaceae bacterium]
MTTDDRRFTIIHNGEIYNYLEIAQSAVGGQNFHSTVIPKFCLSFTPLKGLIV